MARKILGIVGSYRKGGTIDRAIDEILDSAHENGALIKKIFLLDQQVGFCTNCRSCAQLEAEERGTCQLVDDMDAILSEIEGSDALVLGSPINFGTVTAIMKRFVERTICKAHWPWGTRSGPTARNRRRDKRSVVVTSSAMPSLMARFFTTGTGLLKNTASLLGAKNVGTLRIGLAAVEQSQALPKGVVRKARRLGKKLAVK